MNKFGVAQNAPSGPLGEFNFGHDFGFQPDVIFHVLGSDAFSPRTTSTAWEIGEGAAGGEQGLRIQTVTARPGGGGSEGQRFTMSAKFVERFPKCPRTASRKPKQCSQERENNLLLFARNFALVNGG
jgi:hypothetical protein